MIVGPAFQAAGFQPALGAEPKPGRLKAKPHLATYCAFLSLTACGYIGPPQAPALNIPTAVTDLRAGEYGANILVQFTLPALTTDGLTLKSVRAVELFIGPGPSPFSAEAWATSARRFEISGSNGGPPAPGPVTYQAPATEWIGKQVVIGVRSTGPRGKVSGWSNFRVLDVAAPLVRPSAVKAENVARGVAVTWQGPGPRYRVLRAVDKGPLMPLGDANEPMYLDETTVYGTEYTYRVLAVASDTQQSEISEPATVTPVDTFAPAVPAGLTASAGLNSIELAWVRNAESDLAGYNVYRSVGGGPYEKVANLVPTPVYSDMRVEAGKRYGYQVSSVDTAGNESARSEPQEAVAQ